jgi:cytochrome c oxidase cbb3-type subunit 2
VVPESNMPAFVWLEKAPLDGATVQQHMRALKHLGDPYTDADIDGAPAAVEGKTELDALVFYLQGLGKALPAAGAR